MSLMIAKSDDPLPDMPVLPEPPEELDGEPWDELADLAIQLRCEHCKAAPGDWCKTRQNHGAANLHAARMLVVQSCFWLGYAHGFAHGETRQIENMP